MLTEQKLSELRALRTQNAALQAHNSELVGKLRAAKERRLRRGAV